MAVQVLVDVQVLINAVDLTDHVKTVALDPKAELQDTTNMASAGARNRLGGLKDWTLTVEFFNDFAAAKVDATLWPLLGTSTTIEIRPKTAARTATNPAYSGSGVLESYNPIAGTVGEVQMASATFQGNGVLSRLTA